MKCLKRTYTNKQQQIFVYKSKVLTYQAILPVFTCTQPKEEVRVADSEGSRVCMIIEKIVSSIDAIKLQFLFCITCEYSRKYARFKTIQNHKNYFAGAPTHTWTPSTSTHIVKYIGSINVVAGSINVIEISCKFWLHAYAPKLCKTLGLNRIVH